MMTLLWAVKASAILSAAWILCRFLRKQPAAIRHMVWAAAVGGVIALPLVPRVPAASLHLGVEAAWRAVPASIGAGASFAWLSYLWMGGVAFVLVRTGIAAFAAMRILQCAEPVAVEDGVEVRESSDAVTPFVWGLLRPVIVLPAAAKEWPLERRRAAIVHERAHAERRDCWTLLLAQAACALHWFNPLVWLAARELRREQERACDDAVMQAGARPSDYASDLLAIARSSRELSLVPVAAGRRGLEERISAILDPGTNRRTLTKGVLALGVIAMLAVVIPVAAWQEDDRVHKASEEGVTTPKLIYKEEPAYTEEARAAGIEGKVVVSVEIGKDGQARKVRVERGIDPGLDANAIESIKRWMFEPARKDDKPVTVSATIEVNFRLM